jgi:uncharacterized membrane protein YeiH
VSSTTLVVLDLAGIFVFAISGALVAVRRGLDVFGVLVLAGATGLGGGFLRDVLIGATPPAALADWRYLIVPVTAGLVTFTFHPTVGRVERLIVVFDAFGLALFCVTGSLKALQYGLEPVPAALMGMVTAIGGGIVRDVLAGRVPRCSAASCTRRLHLPERPWSSCWTGSTCPSSWSWAPGPASAWCGGCWRCGCTGVPHADGPANV